MQSHSSRRISLSSPSSIKIITENSNNIIHFHTIKSLQSKKQHDHETNSLETRTQPISIRQSYQKRSHPGIRTSVLLTSSLLATYLNTPSIQAANAIGTLAELRNQSFVLQDISFNVYDCEVETSAISALTMNTFHSLSSVNSKTGPTRVIAGFGPNSYVSPSSFHPGVSTFSQDGGHATLTYQQRKITDSVAIPGNGLKFVKLATDELRLSKGIEKGRLY